MAGSGSPQPNRPKPPKPAAEAPRKPLQVMHISRRGEQEKLVREAAETTSPGSEATAASGQLSNAPNRSVSADAASDASRFDLG